MSKIGQELHDLELPIDSPPVTMPPTISLEAMQGRIQELIQMFPMNIPTPEERLRTKIDVPFELLD